MTLQERIQAKVAEKQAAKANQEAVLADNETYVDYLADKAIQSDTIVKLDAIINQLNAMKAIVATDGSRYGVNCYPVSESTFGPVGARLLAIATIAPAMFTTERQVEFTALTSVPYLVALDCAHTLGSAAYVNKAGIYVDEVPYQDFTTPLTALVSALGLSTTDSSTITAANLGRYFTAQNAKAQAKLQEQLTNEALDESPFTLED